MREQGVHTVCCAANGVETKDFQEVLASHLRDKSVTPPRELGRRAVSVPEASNSPCAASLLAGVEARDGSAVVTVPLPPHNGVGGTERGSNPLIACRGRRSADETKGARMAAADTIICTPSVVSRALAID